MKKALTILLGLYLCISRGLHAQVHSFEETLPPSFVTAVDGTLQTSNVKYKLGAKSLKWGWNANSTLTMDNPAGLSAASTQTNGGIYLWIYNTTPNPGKLVFSFLNSSNVEKCKIDFNLNFKGWRFILAGFYLDMNHNKSTLSKMKITAPTTSTGEIYFDHLEFRSTVRWNRRSDAQFHVNQNYQILDIVGINATSGLGTLIAPSNTQVQAINTIGKRIDDWHLGTGQYASSPEFISRKNYILSLISSRYSSNTADLNLTMGIDSTVTGKALYPVPDFIANSNTRRYLDVFDSGVFYPLALDYRMNNNALRKSQWLNIADYLYDQGWADGGQYGDEFLRCYNYYNALFLMRNEMGASRLIREVNNLRWQSLFGMVNDTTLDVGEGADLIRNVARPKLYYALMQSDSVKKATALQLVTNYMNNAFKVHHGFEETFKPDFGGYHHAGPYFSAYYPEALYAAVWIYYVLRDTPYALSNEIYDNLKQCLLNFRAVSSKYNIPVGLTGRFPLQTEVTNTLLPAFAMLGLSKSQPDAQLIAAFKRLWKPALSPVKRFINSSTLVWNPRTLGEIEVCLQANAVNVLEEPNFKMSNYMPYSGTLIHRDAGFHLTVKGYSKYIWDYESGSTEGIYNRYLSYGQAEFTNLNNLRMNTAYSSSFWNWSRLPGTTSKYLAPSDLQIPSNDVTGRHFSDQSFLGGVSLNDSTCIFSMKLHDTKFDNTFYANKSVFAFGKAILFMGSNIRNTSLTARTETTILQQGVKSTEAFNVNGSNIIASQSNINQPIIRDNLNVRYLVKNGNVDIIKNDTLYTALINHGFAPQNGGYAYYMLIQADSTIENKYNNVATCPVVIARQDSVAHIARNTELNIHGYAIFNHTVSLYDQWVNSVNIPSLVMLKTNSSGIESLVISDPDMHRQSGSDMEAIFYLKNTPSAPFNYEIVLNGKYQLNGNNPGVVVTLIGNTTKLSLTVVDGKAYKINLSPIPVQNSLIQSLVFTGENNNGNVLLNWKMEDEHIVENYVIEKSNDLNSFLQKTKVIVKKDALKSGYSIVDENIEESKVFYRLSAISKDGIVVDSKTISVSEGLPKGHRIFPNPATDNVTVKLKETLRDIEVVVYNSNGSAIMSKYLNGDVQEFSLDISKLNPGSYILRIVSASNVINMKFIK